MNEEPPQAQAISLYNGDLSMVPTSVPAISYVTVPMIRSILKDHHWPVIGTKDQLVVQLLQHNRTDAITAREESQLEDLVNIIRQIIRKQKMPCDNASRLP